MVADLGLLDGRRQRFRADGEVQVHRDLARQGQADVGEGPADRRWQERADERLARGAAGEHAAQGERTDERPAVRERLAGRVSHGELGPVPARHADELEVQPIGGRAAFGDRVGAQFGDALADVGGRRRWMASDRPT